MKIEIILASQLMSYQKWLRNHNHMLIRAVPFTNAENYECYRMIYV